MGAGKTVAALILKLLVDATGFSAGLSEAKGQANNAADAVVKASRRMDGFFNSAGALAKQAAYDFASMNGAVGAVAEGLLSIGTGKGGIEALYRGFRTVVVGAAEFETAMVGVRKTVEASDAEYKAFGLSFQNLSSAMGVSAVQIAGVAESAGQLGIVKDDILAFTKTIIELDIASDLTAESGATMMAQFGNVTNLNPQDYDNLASAIVSLGAKGATTESQILALSLRIGGTGAVVGASQQEILALAATYANAGVTAELAGSTINTMWLKMNSAVVSGGKDLANFAQIAGISSAQFVAAWKDSPYQATQMFLSGLQRMNAEGKDVSAALDKVNLTAEGFAGVTARAMQQAAKMNETLGVSKKSWEDQNAQAIEANKQLDTLGGKWGQFTEKLSNAAAKIGALFTPVLGLLLDVAGALLEIDKWGQGNVDAATEFVASDGNFSDISKWINERDPHAAGGFIAGPGGPTSDSIPAWLSNGEYVVNAAATSRFRPFLDAVNAQGFADGGPVSGGWGGHTSGPSMMGPPVPAGYGRWSGSDAAAQNLLAFHALELMLEDEQRQRLAGISASASGGNVPPPGLLANLLASAGNLSGTASSFAGGLGLGQTLEDTTAYLKDFGREIQSALQGMAPYYDEHDSGFWDQFAQQQDAAADEMDRWLGSIGNMANKTKMAGLDLDAGLGELQGTLPLLKSAINETAQLNTSLANATQFSVGYGSHADAMAGAASSIYIDKAALGQMFGKLPADFAEEMYRTMRAGQMGALGPQMGGSVAWFNAMTQMGDSQLGMLDAMNSLTDWGYEFQTFDSMTQSANAGLQRFTELTSMEATMARARGEQAADSAQNAAQAAANFAQSLAVTANNVSMGFGNLGAGAAAMGGAMASLGAGAAAMGGAMASWGVLSQLEQQMRLAEMARGGTGSGVRLGGDSYAGLSEIEAQMAQAANNPYLTSIMEHMANPWQNPNQVYNVEGGGTNMSAWQNPNQVYTMGSGVMQPGGSQSPIRIVVEGGDELTRYLQFRAQDYQRSNPHGYSS